MTWAAEAWGESAWGAIADEVVAAAVVPRLTVLDCQMPSPSAIGQMPAPSVGDAQMPTLPTLIVREPQI